MEDLSGAAGEKRVDFVNVNRRGWFSIRAGFVGLLAALVFGLVRPVGAEAFGDDDGGFYEPAIEALAEKGILEDTECGEELFCPDDEIERWVMAVWLVRVLEDDKHGEVIPAILGCGPRRMVDALCGAAGRVGGDEGVRCGSRGVLPQ